MNFLPVVDRELRVMVRLPRTYYSRSLAALVVAVTSLGMLYAGFGGLVSAMSAGRSLFIVLSVLAYVFVLLEGAFLTADCLSQEKREGTIGLLFLTDLKGYDIVAGKLVSRSLNAAYCVLAALPALGLSIFLGGVTGSDFFRMTLALLNGLFFSVSFGILISALCRSERRALSGALLGVLMFGFVLPALGHALMHFTKAAVVHPFFLVLSPGGSFLSALGAGKGVISAPDFGWSWFTTHLLSWTFLALACVILPRTWQDTMAALSLKRRFRWTFWRADQAAAMPCSRGTAGRWLNVNPMLWLGERPGQKGLGVAAFFVLFAIGWVVGWILYRSLWLDLPVYFGSAFILHLVLMYAATLMACRGSAEDCRSGVLELLLTTPVGADVIVRGRLLAMKRQLFRPVLCVLGADFVLMIAGCFKIGPSFEIIGWMAIFLILVVKLMGDLYALSWVGVWQGWKATNASRAIRQTIYNVVLFRWLVLLGALAALGLLTEGRAFRSPASGVFGVVAYFTLLLMTLLHFCGLAISELKDDLRGLITRDDEREQQPFFWLPFGSGARRSPRSFDRRHRFPSTLEIPLPRRT